MAHEYSHDRAGGPDPAGDGGKAWIDPDSLQEVYGEELELLDELIGIFVKESERLFAQLEGAFAAGDTHRVARSAHALRGSVSNFCAPRAVELFLALEKSAREKGLEGLEPRIAELGRCLKALVLELGEHRLNREGATT